MTMRGLSRLCAAALAVALSLVSSPGVRADESTTGSWSISVLSDGRAYFETSWSDSTGRDSDSEDRNVDVAALGISQELASNGAHVRFATHHDAGDFSFEGWVANGKGGGTYEFTANAAFFDYLRKRGFDVTSIGQEINAANVDITRAYVDEILGTGVTLDYHRLITFRALNIDGAYIRELASVGFVHLDAHDYVTFKALKIDAAYVKYLETHGFGNLTAREVIRMKAQQI